MTIIRSVKKVKEHPQNGLIHMMSITDDLNIRILIVKSSPERPGITFKAGPHGIKRMRKGLSAVL